MMALPALLLLVSGVLAGLPPRGDDIERGVRVAGLDAGSGSWESVAVELEGRFESYLDQPLTLLIDGNDAHVTPRQLGIEIDLDATHERALSVGRGPAVAAAGDRIRAHTRGVNVDPVVTFDTDTLLTALRQLGADEIFAPRDAAFAYSGNTLTIQPSQDGQGIDTAALAEQLRRQVVGLQTGAVEVPLVALPPTVATADLEALRDEAERIVSKPLLLSYDTANWQLQPAELTNLLVYDAGSVRIDTRELELLLGTLSPSIDRPAANASVTHRGDGTFELVPEQDAREFNVKSTLAAVQQALTADADERTVQLVVASERPEITTDRVQPLYQRASEIVERGVVVQWGDGERALDKAGLAGAIRFDDRNGALTFDHAALAAVVEPIAQEVNRPASGLRWRAGVLIASEDALPGRVVDLGASANAIASAALGGQATAPLVVNESSDPAQSASSIVIREMLGTASTYYGSSGFNRRTNVELAAASLDGALVAPGGTFSFNNAIGGTATLDDGYQMGYGIILSDGQARTVPSVAGGICQVATTAFQAAFWSGMPIGTRNWHLYWIPNYGNGPGGLTGLDATVDPDYDLDLTFHNPTSDWLAIRAVADGEWLTVELWGTNQGWQVQVDPPAITNVVKTDPTPRRVINEELEPGQEVVVEHAEDGFTASIHRVVTKDGQVIEDTTFVSYYMPSHNVTLIGPGGDTTVQPPTEEPVEVPVEVPTEVPTEIPTEEPTELPIEEPTPEETPTTEETPVVEETPTEEATPVTEESPAPDPPTETPSGPTPEG